VNYVCHVQRFQTFAQFINAALHDACFIVICDGVFELPPRVVQIHAHRADDISAALCRFKFFLFFR